MENGSKVGDSPGPSAMWDDSPLSRVMEHIVQTHHVFCRREAPRLIALLKETVDRHGKDHQELKQIQALFVRMSQDLSMHLVKEEQTLFPYIARVEDAVKEGARVSWPPFGTVENPIRMMVQEHDQTGHEIQAIRKLSGNYTPPGDAGEGYAALYAGLEAFDRDMQKIVAAKKGR